MPGRGDLTTPRFFPMIQFSEREPNSLSSRELNYKIFAFVDRTVERPYR
jgi:hypothetical protein